MPHWSADLKYLIVEDDPNLRLLWRSVLDDRGYFVLEAASVEDAQSALAAERFDAVVLDLYLGRENGLSLAVAAEKANPDCKVIIVTGAASAQEAELRKQAKCIVSVHRKPVDIEEFLDACLRLDRSRGQAAAG
jgi:DNA-binding NtrC family response regulator